MDSSRLLTMRGAVQIVGLILAVVAGVASTGERRGPQDASTVEVRDVQWSPRGSEVALALRVGNADLFRIALLPVDGGALRFVSDASRSAQSPRWSSDGRRLAFVVGSRIGAADLYVTDIESGSTSRIGTYDYLSLIGSLAWGPQDEHLQYFGDVGQSALRFRQVDLSGTETDTPVPWIMRPLAGVVWSRDGSQITFMAETPPRIFVADPLGRGPRRLTSEADPAVSERLPSWSFDSARVVFTRRAGGSESIWSIRPDGSGGRRLVANGSNGQLSPDGAWLIYLSGREGAYYRYVCRARSDGSEAVAILGAGDETAPCGQPK